MQLATGQWFSQRQPSLRLWEPVPRFTMAEKAVENIGKTADISS